MGGLQANSGGVSLVWSLPAAQVRVRPQRRERPPRAIPGCAKNRRPETASVSYFFTYEAKAVSGSARSLTTAAQAALQHAILVQNRVFVRNSRPTRYTAF